MNKLWMVGLVGGAMSCQEQQSRYSPLALVGQVTVAEPREPGVLGMTGDKVWVVGDQSVDVIIDGLPNTVELDARGYGWVDVTPGQQVVEVQLDGVVSQLLAPAMWPSAAALDDLPAYASISTPAQTTDAWSTGPADQLGFWLADPQGVSFTGAAMVPHQVFTPEKEIVHTQRAHLTLDNLQDVLVLEEDVAWVIAARSGGGGQVALRFQAPDYALVSAVAGDFNGDRLADLAFVWRGSLADSLELWHGDGELGFVGQQRLQLPWPVSQMLVGDNDDQGFDQLTLLGEEGWLRYREGAPGFLVPSGPGSPIDAPVPIGAGYGDQDLDGDGAAELLLSDDGLDEQAETQSLYLYNLASEPVSFVPFTADSHERFTLADLDDDGVSDLVSVDATGDVFIVARERGGEAGYRRAQIASIPQQPSVQVQISDVNQDLKADLITFSPGEGRVWRGQTFPSVFDRFWEPLLLNGWVVSSAAVDAIVVDPAEHLVVVFDDDGAVRMLHVEDDVVTQLSEVRDALQAAPTSFKVCDQVLWASDGTTLAAIDVQSDGLALQGTSLQTLTSLGCGQGPDGAVAAGLTGSQLVLFDGDAAEMSRESSTAHGVTLALEQVHVCAQPGCDVVASQEVVVTATDGVVSHSRQGSTSVWGQGRLSMVDATGDGVDDVLLLSDGRFFVRSFDAAGLGWGPEGHAPDSDVIGLLDVDGDGVPNVLGIVQGQGLVTFVPAPVEDAPTATE